MLSLPPVLWIQHSVTFGAMIARCLDRSAQAESRLGLGGIAGTIGVSAKTEAKVSFAEAKVSFAEARSKFAYAKVENV